jgi:hypothetical protein
MTQATMESLVTSSPTLLSAAVSCRVTASYTMLECAPQLYSGFPQTAANDLAAVLDAVWPDQATPQTLTTALQSCVTATGPAYTADEIAAAAKLGAMFAHDLYMRDMIGDNGQIPSPATQPYQSPDIVPNPDDPSVLGTEWNSDLGHVVVTDPALNHIYVRAWNAYPGPQTGQVFLYWALPSMLLVPSRWTPNLIQNQNGTDHANLVAAGTGVPVVGDYPFQWQPGSPGEDHYCLVARVQTQFQPDTIPADDNLHDFVTWVRDHPGIAWRNVTTVPVKPGSVQQLTVSFGNPEPEPLDYLLAVDCTNLPLRTTVTVTCPIPGPNPPINSVNTVSQSLLQTFFVATKLPPSFTAVLEIEVLPPAGSSLPPTMSVVPRNMLQDPPTPTLAAKAVTPAALGIEDPTVTTPLLYLGDYVFNLVPG